MSLPVFDADQTLVGAVGIDVSLSELFAGDMVTQSADSYFFIVETDSLIVDYHPLLITPIDVSLIVTIIYRMLIIGQAH